MFVGRTRFQQVAIPIFLLLCLLSSANNLRIFYEMNYLFSGGKRKNSRIKDELFFTPKRKKKKELIVENNLLRAPIYIYLLSLSDKSK